jgi:O-antigen ligase
MSQYGGSQAVAGSRVATWSRWTEDTRSAQGACVVWAGLLLIHLPLALIMERYPVVASVHALGVVVIGLAWAFSGARPERVAYAGAYAVGAEVLWRMTDEQFPPDLAKYALAAVLGLLILRSSGLRLPALPISYFALLVPSAWLTIGALGLSGAAWHAVASSLSGPLALAVCVWFFHGRPLSWPQLRTLFWCLVGPLLGIAAIALYGTVTAENLRFIADSNATTSGGFDPNKVSSALGLGGMLSLFLAAQARRRIVGCLAISCCLWFAAQALLTLSRGGIYSAAIGAALALAHWIGPPRQYHRRLAMLALLVVGLAYLVVQLNEFTRGALLARFTSVDTTGREEIAAADLRVWEQNIVLGVGAGMSAERRLDTLGSHKEPHTEFTRLLAEHGILGLLAIFLLLGMVWSGYRAAPSPAARGWVAGLSAWSLTTMSHSAMTIAAPSFVFGLMMIKMADPRASDSGPAPESEDG